MRGLLTALATLLGLQTLRALFPLLVYVLKDRFGLPSTALGGAGLVLFAAAFAMPAVAARLGPAALPRAALALAVARGALQFWRGDPALSLALTAIGTVAFMACLAGAARGPAGRGSPAGAFLIGALADAAVHALFGTRDLHWGGSFADPVAGVLIGLTLAVAWASLRDHDEATGSDGSPAELGLLAWGPFVYLQLELLGNVARLAARTPNATAAAGAVLGAGLAVGWAVARHAPRRGAPGSAVTFVVAALALAAGLAGHGALGSSALPALALAQVGAAVLLARALAVSAAPRRTLGAGAAFGGGFVLLLVFFFAHYAGYDLPLPVSRTGILLAAGGVLALGALGGRRVEATAPRRTALAGAVALAVLAAMPLARSIVFPSAAPPPDADPARVRMITFNLHAGFDETGRWAFDREMENLRDARPDVVALQEVSRGWVINGCADLFELSREALGMPGVAGPSVQTDWGNAVFARWEHGAFENVPIPPDTLPIPRAVSVVDFAVPGAGDLRVLATHLHHPTTDDGVRDRQATFAARLADDVPDRAAVLLGDFNALPDSECLAVLRRAGWRDVHRPEVDAGHTFPSTAPVRRIDTILLRGPWSTVETRVAPAWGSDHRAVIADLVPQPNQEAAGNGSR